MPEERLPKINKIYSSPLNSSNVSQPFLFMFVVPGYLFIGCYYTATNESKINFQKIYNSYIRSGYHDYNMPSSRVVELIPVIDLIGNVYCD